MVYMLKGTIRLAVALRKESVDRNAEKMKVGGIDVSSLSARRAWIEIVVDGHRVHITRSLSARRAWIEIGIRPKL